MTDHSIVLKAVRLGASPDDVPVADVMAPRVVAIGSDADLVDAMRAMSSHRMSACFRSTR